MYNIFGFLIAVFFVREALVSLGVNSQYYFDEVAFLIVFGGTLAAMVISFPPKFLFRFFSAPWKMLRDKKPNLIYSVESLIVATHRHGGKRSYLKNMLGDAKLDDFLKEGIELYLLDLKKSEFRDILTERIYRGRQRDEEWVNLYRRLAKYPPAFGLVGTVLGLVSLMRTVGEGANASEIGINMALALTATLYGLAFANFVLAPIAENFQQVAEDRKVFRELMLEGLLMIYDQSGGLAMQEMLNSYLEPHKRVDIVGIHKEVAS